MSEILSLFTSADKPQWMTAPQFSVMVCLLGVTTEEHPVTNISQDTIAQRTCLARKTVGLALSELKQQKLINIRSGKRRYNSNVYEVLFQSVPTERTSQNAAGESALALAGIYKQMWVKYFGTYLTKHGPRNRKLSAKWRTRWGYVIQKWLDAGATEQQVTQMFNWAALHQKKQFIAGPQSLSKFWERKAQ
jgi:hypothetical protein